MARRRRRWPLVLGLIAGLGVLGVAAGAITLRTPWVEGVIADLVVDELEKATHEEASLDRARVTFWPPGLELTGLVLTEDQSRETLVRVDAIRANVVLRDGGPKLGVLRVEHPVVRLTLDERGRLQAFQAPEDDGDDEPGTPLAELPFYNLDIRDADLELLLPEGRVALTDLDVTPVQGRDADLTGALSVQWRAFEDHADLELQRITLGPETVSIPDLRLDLTALQTRGSATVPLQGDLEAELHLRSALQTLSPLLTGPRYLEGFVQADVSIHGPPTDPTAHVELSGSELAYDAPGRVWPRTRYSTDALSATLDARRDEIIVTRLVAREDDGTVTVTGRAAPVSQPDGTERWEVSQAHIEGQDLSLAALLRAFSAAPNPWVDFRGNAIADVSGPLVPLELSGSYDIDLADFQVRQGPVDDPHSTLVLGIPTASYSGTLTLFKDHIVLDGETLETPRNAGPVHASIGFGPKGPLDLDFDLRRADLRDIRPLGGSAMKGRGRLTGRLWGDFDDLQVRGTGVLDGFEVSGIPYADRLEAVVRSPDMRSLELVEARGTRGDTRYFGTFAMDFAAGGLPMDTDVVITEGRVEDLVGMFLDLGDVVTGNIEDGTLVLSGPLNDMDGAADLQLTDVTLVGERFETGRAAGRMHEGTFTLDTLQVRRGEDEGLTVRGSIGREWALDLEGAGELRLETMDALADSSLPVRGRASAVFRVDNTLFDPAPHGRLRLWDVEVAGQPVPDSVVNAETTSGTLLAHGDLVGDSVRADLSIGLWEDQPYTLLADLDSFPVDRLYPVAADGQEVLARVSGEVELWGHLGETPSDPEVRIRLPRVVLGWDRHTLVSDEAKPWTFRSSGKQWELGGVALTGEETSVSLMASGRDDAVLIGGGGQVNADLLRAFVPGLTRVDGGLDVSVASLGRAGEATTHLDVALDAPLMRHEGVPAALEDVKARVHLTPDRFEVTHFETDVGGGRLVGDARRSPRLAERFSDDDSEPLGVIEADSWVPTRFELLGRADDVQMQWVEDLPPAIGDATLSFDGPADSLLLHADIGVVDMAFTERIDWEDWVVAFEDYLLVPAPPSDEPPWFGLDIDIRADHTIRLLNNVSDATASADLTLMGDTSRMGLIGRVRVEDGVVYVQDRAFDVQRGELRFDDPFSWDPLLDFDLRTDVQSRARQYRVSYRIAGPYSSWTSTASSNPRLPQSDVNALLWFGVTADDLEDMGELQNAVGMVAFDFVAKDFVQNDYLGLGLRDVGERLPEFDLNTGVNLRGEYTSEPRVLFKQRFSPTLSAQLELNLIRDDHSARVDWRADESLILSAWWASRRRDGFVLPIMNGALGADLRWVAEFD